VSATTAVLTARSAGRVLVVDDSAVIRQAISKMLKVDFEVVVANDGEAGWDALTQASDIGVLITDIEMPRLDGYAFICRVRASDEPGIRDLPIIVITGADDEETKARAFACGATDFITKPLNLAQLQACTQAYMRFEKPLPENEDPTDGLLGRRAFNEQGQALWGQVETQGPLALLAIAIDKVRILYREYGDEKMETLVKHAVTVIGAEVPPQGAHFARLGGAEFGILVSGMSKAQALTLGQRLVGVLAARPVLDGKILSMSVGVASSEEGLESFVALGQMAEDRLKRAVALGGNRVSASNLSDTLGGAEELVLDGVSPSLENEEETEAGSESLLEPEFVSEPLTSLDFATRESPRAAPRGLISLDRALWHLADGREREVEPYLDHLTSDIVVLLEFLDDRRHLGLQTAIASLRRSIDRGGSD